MTLNLEKIMLSEISQSQMIIFHLHKISSINQSIKGDWLLREAGVSGGMRNNWLMSTGFPPGMMKVF